MSALSSGLEERRTISSTPPSPPPPLTAGDGVALPLRAAAAGRPYSWSSCVIFFLASVDRTRKAYAPTEGRKREPRISLSLSQASPARETEGGKRMEISESLSGLNGEREQKKTTQTFSSKKKKNDDDDANQATSSFVSLLALFSSFPFFQLSSRPPHASRHHASTRHGPHLCHRGVSPLPGQGGSSGSSSSDSVDNDNNISGDEWSP